MPSIFCIIGVAVVVLAVLGTSGSVGIREDPSPITNTQGRARTMHGSRIFGALGFASVAIVAAPASVMAQSTTEV